ncbi:porin family protein (plasmid) [Bernardetia sp. Wsw4-3y2]|uniref:type IX secretion/gliding motility protein PorT/SprT n=1 Tax=unclassified Bernardetia TaxID=2647129 RepID=UPI0030D2C478
MKIRQKNTLFSVLFVLLFFGITFSVSAQVMNKKKPVNQDKKLKDKSLNIPDYDSKPLHYGFILGLHYATMRINYSDYFTDNTDTTIALLPQRSFSNFAVGMIIDIPLADQWNFRFTPTVGLYEYSITHKQLERSSGKYVDTKVPVESVFFDFPILMKYKSIRRNNNRMYMVGGIVPSIKVGGRKQRNNQEAFGMEDYNLEVTYGLGWDHYFSFFKFAPEIRFSHGIANMNLRNQSVYYKNIDRMTTHKISLLFHFE